MELNRHRVAEHTRHNPKRPNVQVMHDWPLSQNVFQMESATERMARADAGNDGPREIRLIENPDGRWTARDRQVGLSAQGETRETALANLDDVVETVTGDGGHEPTDEELHELGVDPDVARSQSDDPPDVLR